MIQVDLDDKPYHELRYLNAGPRRSGAVRDTLPFLRGRVLGLPEGAPAIVATSDLQGRSDFGDADETLLGCRVAEELPDVQDDARLPRPGESMALLGGDLFAVANVTRRGGLGDVTAVWHAFERRFATVLGVLGNHDSFGSDRRSASNHLDGRVVQLGPLAVGGVSGIVGEPGRPNRRSAEEFTGELLGVLAGRPDVLLLHQPPHLDRDAPGSPEVAEVLLVTGFAGLVVCGHARWAERLRTLGQATVLNVEAAVVTLEPTPQ